MTTLIRNGTIITASDKYEADLYIDKGIISLIGRGLTIPAETIIDASGQLVMPGGVDVHTHLDMPFGGTTSADDFETGTIAAAHGGTTTLIDFAIQDFGGGLYPAFDGWMKRAEGKAVIDYAFHIIVRELSEQVSVDMDRMVRHDGVTSFKLFMAYPGVFMVDDATIFKALLKTRENGGLICMHAENGGVIDTLVKEALRKGERAPKYHALTRPTRAEGEATGRAIALAEMAGVPIYIVHLSCADALEKVRQARDMGLPAYAETCPQYLFLSYDDYEREGFEGAKFVMSSATAREMAPGRAVARHRPQQPAGRLDRPLSVLHERAAAEAGRPGRLLEDSQWRAWHRDAPDAAVGRRRARPSHRRPPLRRDRCRESGQDVRLVAAQGNDRRRVRRRCRHLGSEPYGHAVGQDASHARRLQPVRGARRHRSAIDGALAW